MADPRLNSVHLDPPRREEYRRARDVLLHARGFHTVALENRDVADLPDSRPDTYIQKIDNQMPPPGLKCWLADQDVIYPLKVGLNTIGRAPENDVVLPDGYVSRRHCAIVVHAGNTCEVHDTASKNGTFLNGQKLAGPTRLRSGDKIRMCDKQLTFLARGDAPAADGFSPTLVP